MNRTDTRPETTEGDASRARTADPRTIELRAAARAIFDHALARVDPAGAVADFVRRDGSRLVVGDDVYDLDEFPLICSVAIGKAARPMASALSAILGGRLTGGVLSAPRADVAHAHANSRGGATTPHASWHEYAGGHPLPDEESIAAARAARRLLRLANTPAALVIFLVSGGGSAMMDLPREPDITLDDLRRTNELLVRCSATISEVNRVRRHLSSIKGGGFSVLAHRARRVTLIVSDTNRGDEASVASGPTIARARNETLDARRVVTRYGLAQRLPASVSRALDTAAAGTLDESSDADRHRVHVVLDNDAAIRYAAEQARARGFRVEVARDLVEQPIAEGCAELVHRLDARLEQGRSGETVCLISGGEFRCEVRGRGAGGRNAEAALRCAIELSERPPRDPASSVVLLHAGTDGIDGNSPAAGALADHTTIERAGRIGIDARDHLDRSDAYTFFARLGDDITTGATGTNVRDLRILLARKS